jgi:hypothetical protein
MTLNTTLKTGYLVITTPLEEENIYTIKETLEEDNNDNIISLEEQGNKLIVTITYEDIEEIAEIGSSIVYTSIIQGIYSISIKYCGKETNSRSNRNTQTTYSSLPSNNNRNTSFDSYLRGSLTI